MLQTLLNRKQKLHQILKVRDFKFLLSSDVGGPKILSVPTVRSLVASTVNRKGNFTCFPSSTLFVMGFLGPSAALRHVPPPAHHNFLYFAPMIMKFSTIYRTWYTKDSGHKNFEDIITIT